ncbi:hypothetical protein [Herbaspirillum sp. C9C3]|uniref:hypothetical protein n=1 Tax=Herbaspirillum sp. C9C3 TaxID=2735271 RepID=UPI0015851718|nr:hypothetical protein [Herbaspirillum sp. C9C3]NUT60840.1 hypothetical protein [Herbaspirillum sp. C9C3]
MNQTLKLNICISEIKLILDFMGDVPDAKVMSQYFRECFEKEMMGGRRSSYLNSLKKEALTVARETSSRKKWEELSSKLRDCMYGEVYLAAIVKQGKVENEEALRKLLRELDIFIQNDNSDLTPSQKTLVEKINFIINEYKARK